MLWAPKWLVDADDTTACSTLWNNQSAYPRRLSETGDRRGVLEIGNATAAVQPRKLFRARSRSPPAPPPVFTAEGMKRFVELFSNQRITPHAGRRLSGSTGFDHGGQVTAGLQLDTALRGGVDNPDLPALNSETPISIGATDPATHPSSIESESSTFYLCFADKSRAGFANTPAATDFVLYKHVVVHTQHLPPHSPPSQPPPSHPPPPPSLPTWVSQGQTTEYVVSTRTIVSYGWNNEAGATNLTTCQTYCLDYRAPNNATCSRITFLQHAGVSNLCWMGLTDSIRDGQDPFSDPVGEPPEFPNTIEAYKYV